MKGPKGKLLAIGGGEDKERNMRILHRFIEESGGTGAYIEIITTATNLPEEVGEDYSKALDTIGCKNYDIIHVDTREDANEEKFLKRLKKANGILFTGGSQLKLSTILGGTEFLKLVKEKYISEKFVVAGTSAGAAAMSDTMIVKGSSEDSLIKGSLQMAPGLGFLQEVIVDTHFTQRGRFGRLIQAAASNPACLGLGLAEDTGVIISNGNTLETIGSGLVVIVDGQNIKYTNLTDVYDGDPISIEQVNLHILSKGDAFVLDERKFLRKEK
jgi:cyanophycinase